MFTLTIHTDNSVFHDAPPEMEVARILEATARKLVEWGAPRGTLRDANGNTVGSYELTP